MAKQPKMDGAQELQGQTTKAAVKAREEEEEKLRPEEEKPESVHIFTKCSTLPATPGL